MTDADRSMTVRRRRLLALTAIAALPAGASAADPTTLRVSFPAGIGTLDPAKFRVGGLETHYANCVFNRLTRQDENLATLPDLALRWEPSADLKTWTFFLRPGVKFHNGHAFDAADVLFTYARLQDKEVASVLRAALDMVVKIEAVDPLTVRFTMSIPYADLPAVCGGFQAMILTEGTMASLTTEPVGTGPFMFVEYRPGDQMVLKRNPDYFLPGLPKVDRAILRIIPEQTTAAAALESGSIDLMFNLPSEQVDRLSRNPNVRVIDVASGNWEGLIMHNGMKPFDNPKVREAFIKLVDKPTLTDIATFGRGNPAITPIPPSHKLFRKDLLTGPDIPGAKRLLAEAGFGGGMKLEMHVPGSTPSLERLATAFRDTAKQVGIAIDLRVIPQDKFFAEMEGRVLFNVDYFAGRATPDLMLYSWYHSSGSWNNTLWHYKNDEVDRLLDEARSTADPERQAELYGRFQGIIAKDGPGIIVYVRNFACGVSKKVSGLTVLPLMLVDFTAATIAA